MKIRRKLAGLSACALIMSSMTVPMAQAANFADTNGHWGESSIVRWADYGIVQGLDGTHFSPDTSMTRAQMATILANLLGLEAKIENPFADVPAGAWYEDAILKCAAAGIMKGTSDTTADPNSPITREQASVMLARALGIKEGSGPVSFDDAGQVADWAAGYVKAMAELGIINGVGGNVFAPKADITRAAVTAILDRSISAYANEEGKSIEASGSGITLVAAKNVTVTGAAKNVLIAPGAVGTTKLDGVNVSGEVIMRAPGGTLELSGATSAASISVPEGADSATVSIAKEASVGALTTAADDVKIIGEGKVSDMTVSSGKGVSVAASVAVSKITNNSDDDMKHGDKVIAGQKPDSGDNSGSSGSSGGSSGGSSSGSSGVSSVAGGNSSNNSAGPSKPSSSKYEQDPGTSDDKKPVDEDENESALTVTELQDKATAFSGKGSKKLKIEDETETVKRNIANDAQVTLKLDSSVEDDFEFDLNGQNLGDVIIEADSASVTITDSTKTASVQNLIVDTPEATVNVNVPVTGTLTVKDISKDTLNVYSQVKNIILALISATKEAHVNVAEDTNKPVIKVDTDRPVILSGLNKDGTVNSTSNAGEVILSKDKANVTVATKVESVTGAAKDTEVKAQKDVTLKGTIGTVTTDGADKVTVETGAVVETAIVKKGTIDGTGSVNIVDTTGATDNVTVAVPAEEVVTSSNVTINSKVEKVTVNGGSDVKLEGSGSVVEISAKASVVIDVPTDKVAVDGDNVKITANKSINTVETSKTVTITGIGEVSNVDVNAANVTINAGKNVSSVNATADNKPTVKDETGTKDNIDVVTNIKAATPDKIAFKITNNSGASGSSDGKIEKADSQDTKIYEYAESLTSEWRELTSATTLAAGTYYVRAKAGTGETAPSTAIPVTVRKVITDAEMTGTPYVGQTMTAIPKPEDATVESYEWTEGNLNSKTLALTDEMVGKDVSVTITGYDTTGDTAKDAEATAVKPQADKSALVAALATAQSLYDSVGTGKAIAIDTSAGNVQVGKQWVTSEAQTALGNAIDNAKKSNVDGKKTTEVATAVSDLKNKITDFRESIQMGTRSATSDEITAAKEEAITNKNSVESAESGDKIKPDVQWVRESDKTEYQEAIKAATDDEGLKKLAEATQKFNNAKHYGTPIDLTALNTAIATAQAKHDATKVAANAEDVLPSEKYVTDNSTKTTLSDAIGEAKKALTVIGEDGKYVKSAYDVAEALKTLEGKIADFDKECKVGEKDIIAPTLSSVSIERSAAMTSAVVSFTSDEAGTYEYIAVKGNQLKENADTPATVEEVVENAAEEETNITGTGVVTEGDNSFTINGLDAARAYTVTVTVKDVSGNATSFQRLLNGAAADAADVVAAPAHDQSGTITNDADIVKNLSVTAKKAEGAENTVNVTVTGQDLKKHQNTEGEKDYWVGIGVPVEDGVEYTYYAGDGSTIPETLPAELASMKGRHFENNSKTYASLYVTVSEDKNVENADKYWLVVKGTKDEVETTTNYLIDVSGVTLSKADVPEAPKDLTVTPAALETPAEGKVTLTIEGAEDGTTVYYKVVDSNTDVPAVGDTFTETGWTKYTASADIEAANGKYIAAVSVKDGKVAQKGVSEAVNDGVVKPDEYTVTIATMQNGSVTAEPTKAAADATVTLTVTPAEGYQLKADSLKVTKTAAETEPTAQAEGDDAGTGSSSEAGPSKPAAGDDNAEITVTKGADGTYTFTMPAYDVTVSAEFEKNSDISIDKYTVTIATMQNGSVTADPTEAAADATVTLTVTPAEGYQLKADSLKVTKTAAETEPAAQAEGDDAGTGSSSEAGPSKPAAGDDNAEITVTKGADGTYTFTMPAYDVTVSAEFEKNSDISIDKYTVTIATMQNGSVTADPTEAAANATVTLTVTPAEGYQLKADSLKVTKTVAETEPAAQAEGDDAGTGSSSKAGPSKPATGDDNAEITVTEGADSTYTFTMPAYDVTVSAEFENDSDISIAVLDETAYNSIVWETKPTLTNMQDITVASTTPESGATASYKVTGTLKSVTGFTDFSSVAAEQNGYYAAVKVGNLPTTSSTAADPEVLTIQNSDEGSQAKSITYSQLDGSNDPKNELYLVLYIAKPEAAGTKGAKKFTITVNQADGADPTTKVYTLDFTGVTLETAKVKTSQFHINNRVGSTLIEGVDWTFDAGDVGTISYGGTMSVGAEYNQVPNTSLGADAKTIYLGLEIEAPEGATHVWWPNENSELKAVALGGAQSDGTFKTTDNGKEVKGILKYVPVGKKDETSTPKAISLGGYDSAKEFTIRWGNTDMITCVQTYTISCSGITDAADSSSKTEGTEESNGSENSNGSDPGTNPEGNV